MTAVNRGYAATFANNTRLRESWIFVRKMLIQDEAQQPQDGDWMNRTYIATLPWTVLAAKETMVAPMRVHRLIAVVSNVMMTEDGCYMLMLADPTDLMEGIILSNVVTKYPTIITIGAAIIVENVALLKDLSGNMLLNLHTDCFIAVFPPPIATLC